jgi:hypothetical protein
MVQAIIFSYDRAIFLDTLLKSYYKHNKSDLFDLSVIYNSSNEIFEEGYRVLKKRYNCKFIKESFRENRLSLIDLTYLRNIYRYLKFDYYRKNKSNFKDVLMEILQDKIFINIVFFTDDSLIYRKFIIEEYILQKINDEPENLSFHLRFGDNYTSKPNGIEYEGNYIKWNTSDNYDKDWSYRFSVDGQIYNKHFLLKNFKKILFINPSTFEGNVNYYFTKNNLLKKGMCFKESCIVGFEINRVQEVNRNNSLNINNEILNKYFLEGYEMEYIHHGIINGFRPQLEDILLKKDNESISLLKQGSNINK